MFVKYLEDSGQIIGISPRDDLNHHSIKVDFEEVKNLIEGKESKRNYRVEYNPKKKDLELIHIHEQSFDGSSVRDFIYEIPEIEQKDPDLLIIQDQKNTCWRIKLGNELQQKLKSKGIRLNSILDFSITALHDPNVLYKTFSVDFSNIFQDNEVLVDFSMAFEETDQPVSVFTAKRFDTYQFKRVLNV
jgi:hypothetical protein